tara:strand:+ start:420 stop:767 length:348 start_codon:yes stop_codon:yes gene_type:complete
MSNKEELVMIIKEWIDLDDKLKEKQIIIKELKNKKKITSDNLMKIMKENEIDCFDVTSGKIVYCKNKTRATLNKKSLLENLEKFFEDNNDVNPAEVRDYLLENREIKVRENIKRK